MKVKGRTSLRKLLYSALRDWKLDHYSQEYGKCRMTLAKAAEEAGVTIWEMMACLRQKKIPAQYDLDDLKHDIDGILSRQRRKLPASKI